LNQRIGQRVKHLWLINGGRRNAPNNTTAAMTKRRSTLSQVGASPAWGKTAERDAGSTEMIP
jgi:hypothetical protein